MVFLTRNFGGWTLKKIRGESFAAKRSGDEPAVTVVLSLVNEEPLSGARARAGTVWLELIRVGS